MASTGKPFLRETRAMTEEPGPFFRNGSRLVLVDPALLVQRGSGGIVDGETKGDVKSASRRWTQTDQDQTDAELRKRALKELCRTWMDRLQLISVITTFFAATEAQLLGFTTPDDGDHGPLIQQATNAILAGALVVHLCAAIISFLAAFFLVSYRLGEARREELKVELGLPMDESIPTPSGPTVWTSNPHLEQVGPFRRHEPPMHLLEHCHGLCMWLAAVGFVLALTGVVCYTWARLPKSASIFATTCMAVCWVAGIGSVVIVL